jgi:hypothetical protein
VLHVPKLHMTGSAVGEADRARPVDRRLRRRSADRARPVDRRLRRRGPHPHVEPGFDEHPWRVLPVALLAIVVFAAVLIVASFAISKAMTGHAY